MKDPCAVMTVHACAGMECEHRTLLPSAPKGLVDIHLRLHLPKLDLNQLDAGIQRLPLGEQDLDIIGLIHRNNLMDYSYSCSQWNDIQLTMYLRDMIPVD